MPGKIIKISGCHDCPYTDWFNICHHHAKKGLMFVGKYDVAETIHPDCPLEDPQERTGNLYGVVEWLAGYPILNGMKYFTTKAHAIKYSHNQTKLTAGAIGTKHDILYTIIGLDKGDI